MAILDFLKKRKTGQQTAASTQKTTTTGAAKSSGTTAARQSTGSMQSTSAGSRVGNTAGQYQNAGRLGGDGRREIERAYTDTAAAKSGTTQTKPASQSAASPLAERLYEVKYAAANQKAAETIKKTVAAKQQSMAKPQTAPAKSTPTVKSTVQTKPTAKPTIQAKPTIKKTADAVAAHGSMEDYTLVKKAAAKVDFADWDKKTTTQQRMALKRSDLSDEEQWKLLNRDNGYIETLSVIADLRDNRIDYGLSISETEQISSELLSLAAMRANASGNGQPYLSAIPRAEMVKYLDEQKTALLQSVGYLPTDDVGADAGVWYDGEEAGPILLPTPPRITPKPMEMVQRKNIEALELLYTDREVNRQQLQAIKTAMRQIEDGGLSEIQQKRIVEDAQIAVEKLEKIKKASDPKWRKNYGDDPESLGIKLMDYDYFDGQYWLEVICDGQKNYMPLGREVPESVIVWAKKATIYDVVGRNIGQTAEIIANELPDHILFGSKGYDFSLSYVPFVNKFVEENNPLNQTSHITEDTVSVFAWIYAPNSFGKVKRTMEQIRFNDFIGMG